MGTLFLVATPIGNLQDITFRALEILQQVEAIICEDKRRTGLLLNHYQLNKPLLILNDFNEVKMVTPIIDRLKSGQSLALVSDAGTPLISDPGYKLVREAIREDITVDSIPGPSSALTALTLSGLPPDKFLFLGYLPEKRGPRLKLLQQLTTIHDSIKVTYIAFIAPHKLIRTLEDLHQVSGNIEVVLAKELTKIHQSVKKQSLKKWLEEFQAHPPKGEYVLLFNLTSS